MKISEVIANLTEIKERDGDLPCYLQQLYGEDDGDITRIECIETCEDNEHRRPFLVRMMDYVD